MGKNKIGVILIVVLLVLLLASFIGGFIFLYKTMNKPEVPKGSAVVTQEVAIEDITNFLVGEEPILTNLLQGPDKKSHVIQVNVSLGVNTSKKVKKDAEKLLALLEVKKVIIKDIIIGVCRSKTYEELNKGDASAIIKDEILIKLKKRFETELIVDVYIDNIFIE